MKKLNCLIVDDEPIARKGMMEYASEIDFLHVVAQCENAVTATSYLQIEKIDLLFLDIQMPKLTGIDFIKSLSHPPMTIFTTAYSEYAAESYSLDVIDYLVKPIAFERFMKAVNKAKDFDLQKKGIEEVSPKTFFFVKSEGCYEKILFDEITFVESMQNYVVIHTLHRKLVTYLTLNGLEKQLPVGQFIKVHKSYLVALARIDSVDGNEIVINKDRVPISRSLKEEVMNKIVGNHLVKR